MTSLLALHNYTLKRQVGCQVGTGLSLLLDRCHLTLEPGEIVALLGPNGSGKTSLLKKILDIDPMLLETGTIALKGKEIQALTPQERRALRGATIGYVPQNAQAHLTPLLSIGQHLEEAASRRLMPWGVGEFMRCCQEFFQALHLPPYAEMYKRKGYMLSGGEAQKMMLVMALLPSPDLLLLDEPESALDDGSHALFMAVLKEYVGGMNAPAQRGALWITHDHTFAAQLADRRVYLQNHQLISERQKTQASHVVPPNLSTKTGAQEARHGALQSVLLSLKDVQVSPTPAAFYRASKPIFSHFTADIYDGEFVGLRGANGIGKTTLALSMMQQRAYEGTITYKGQDLRAMTTKARAEFFYEVRFLFQTAVQSLNPSQTIREIYRAACRCYGVAFTEEAAITSLEHVGLPPECLDAYPHMVSGGEAQRIAIARLMIGAPQLIILDEPTAGLDAQHKSQFLEVLMTLKKTHGITLLMLSHDPHVMQYTDRIIDFEAVLRNK